MSSEITSEVRRVTTALLSKVEIDGIIAQHIAEKAGINLSSQVNVEVHQVFQPDNGFRVILTETMDTVEGTPQ